MAFAKKTMVFQGNNGRKLSTKKSPDAAQKEVARLHKKNHPLPKNRGAAAKKRFG